MDHLPLADHNSPGSEALRRWVTVWNVISVAMALFTTVFALLDQPNSLPTSLLIIGFGLVYLLWYWVFIIHLERWGRCSLALALSFAVVMLALAGMTFVHGIYSMQLFSLYGIVFSVLVPRLAIPLTIFLSALGAVLITYRNGVPLGESWGALLGFGAAAFFSVLMGLFISAIIRQSAERQQIIDELNAAREDLARAERQAGILEERQRLAREIHDTLAQGFTSIVMHLEAADAALSADEVLPTDPARSAVRQHLDRARTTARESLAEARRFVWALRTGPQAQAGALERESLAQAIRRVAQHWAEETGLSAQVEISGVERPLPSPYEVTLLRTAQEALANIRKHAAARQATLTLTYMEDQVILDVQDDGQGFDPGMGQASRQADNPAQPGSELEVLGEVQAIGYTNIASDGSGFGLIGMRERAEQLGGSLIIESAPGEGTTLVVALPLNSAAHLSTEVS